MKLCICSRADERIKSWTDLTFPRIKALADRGRADFIVLDSANDISTHYRIMDLYPLFLYFDRILHIDSDGIVIKGCPNPFEVVPENCIGTVYEDLGSRADNRRLRIKEIQEKFGDVGWTNGYINTGFFMASKMHKKIFTPINGGFWQSHGWDDVHLGYKIHQLGFKIHELPWHWNAMSMFFEPWNKGPRGVPNLHTEELYMVHCAGCGPSDGGIQKKYLEIKKKVELFDRLGK